MVTKTGVPGVEFQLGTTAMNEYNYLEWKLTVTGPVRGWWAVVAPRCACTVWQGPRNVAPSDQRAMPRSWQRNAAWRCCPVTVYVRGYMPEWPWRCRPRRERVVACRHVSCHLVMRCCLRRVSVLSWVACSCCSRCIHRSVVHFMSTFCMPVATLCAGVVASGGGGDG